MQNLIARLIVFAGVWAACGPGGGALQAQAIFAGTDPVIDEGSPDSWANILYIDETHTFDFGGGGQTFGEALEFRFWADGFDGTVTPLVVEVVAPNEFIVRAIGTTRRGGDDWFEPGLQEFPFKDGETIVVQQGWAAGFISATPEGEEGGSPIPFAYTDVDGWLTGSASAGSGTPYVVVGEPPVLGMSGTDPDAFGLRRYAFQVTATPADPRPPTDIIANPQALRTGLAAGATVATLTAVDLNANDTHTFALVDGEGAADNARFTVDGAALKAVAALGGDGTEYSIRMRVSDGAGLTFERALEFAVIGDRPPGAVRLESVTLLSVQPIGFTVGVIRVEDANIVQGDTHVFQLVAGAGSDDNTAFMIEEDRLLLNIEPEAGHVYRIRIRATDAAGLSREETFELPVSHVIGNSLDPRSSSATDTAVVPIFYTNGIEMPGAGTVEAVTIPLQAASQLGLTFHMFQLRPTGMPDEYLVVGDSGIITVEGTVGELATFTFPDGPLSVLPGDLFFHYGRGIPFDAGFGNSLPIRYPCPVSPVVDEPLDLALGNFDFPLREDLSRDYAWAVHFVPGAASELRLLSLSLQPETRMVTLTWASRPGIEYRISGSSDLKAWDENVETDIPSGAGATTTWTFGPVTLPGSTFYRVEESP